MPRGVYPRSPGTSYNKKHDRVRRARGPARQHDCERCGSKAAEWATIHGTDGMGPEDYLALCRSCHRKYDFNPENIQAATRAKIGIPRPDLADRNRERTGWKQSAETRVRIAEGVRKFRQSSEE